jgi:hypothetical protein
VYFIIVSINIALSQIYSVEFAAIVGIITTAGVESSSPFDPKADFGVDSAACHIAVLVPPSLLSVATLKLRKTSI